MAPAAESGDALRHPDGRPARIVLLLYGSPDHDSRVLKSAAALRDAGAEVLIVGRSIIHSGAPEGHSRVGPDLPVYRTRDLDLTRTLPGLTRSWRRLRRSVRARRPTAPSPASVPAAASGSGTGGSSAAASGPSSPDGGTGSLAPGQAAGAAQLPNATAAGASGLKTRLADVYMRGYDVTRIVRYWLEAIQAAKRFRPDVVHANDANTLPPALALRLLCRSRIVYDSHELWTRRNVLRRRWLAPHVEALIERVGVRRAHAVITVSDSIAAWMQEQFRLRRKPVVVRNIPRRQGPLPTPGQGRLRELAGLDPEQQVIVYCGGLAPGRGLEETIEALAQLPERMHLVLLGWGAPGYVASLLQQAREQQVAERVHIVPPVPSVEVPITMADADAAVVFVRPVCLSYRYALPNKLFESIHAGLPIVAGDLPDIAAVVRGTGAGELFAVEDPLALAAAVRTVIADPAPYRDAARRAARELDWRHEAAALVQVHRGAVRGFPV